MNIKKDKIMKEIWFDSEKQYKKLINSIEGNFKEEIFDIMFSIWKSGGL